MAVTGRYTAVTSRYGAVTNLTSRYGVGWLQRACAVQRHSLRSQPSSEGLAPWVVPSALLPQGDSLWLAPSAHVCGRLLGREAGRWPTSWGYYSTPVRILQWGWRGPRTPASARRWGRMVLSWLAPSISKGSGLACAAIPPAYPPTFLETGGLPLYPRRGLRPLPPAWRDEEGTVVPPSPPSNAFGNRGTHHTPAEATPPAPCVGTAGGQGRFLTFPRVRGQGQRRPRGAWEKGMGPLRSAIQHGHSAVIAQSSAVIARS